MKTVGALAAIALLGSGALLLVLGLLVWVGVGPAVVLSVHIVLGFVLVISLWTLAAIAARAGVPLSTVAFATTWGVIVLAFGLVQARLLPGAWHWVVQVAHVAISMGAIWWGRRLVQLTRRAAAFARRGPEGLAAPASARTSTRRP